MTTSNPAELENFLMSLGHSLRVAQEQDLTYDDAFAMIKDSLSTYIAERYVAKEEVLEARIDELSRLDTRRHYGKDYQESLDELDDYKDGRLAELRQAQKQDTTNHE